MGMYDTVVVEYPLGDGVEATVFQTHSLSCEKQQYTITPEGRLMLSAVTVNDGRGWSGGNYDFVEVGSSDMEFHGDLYIHAKGGLEFRVRFTDGVVTQVKKLGGG